MMGLLMVTLYIVGVDITDVNAPVLIPTADDNIGDGEAVTQAAATPITSTTKAGMGTTDAAGAAVTDMVRSIQSSVSTEGMMEETTYFVNGQIVGYSSTESTGYGTGTDPTMADRYRYRYRYRHT